MCPASLERNPRKDFLPELIYGSREPATSAQITRLLKTGRIRKIAPRLYTSNLTAPAEEIVRRNILAILGRLYPGTLLSHRSAFEFEPTDAGDIFVTTSYTRKVRLPGVQVHFLQGPPPLDGDNLLTGQLHVSQKARAFLENLQTTRKQGEDSKCLPVVRLEAKLEQFLQVHGENGLNALRDQARELAGRLDMSRASERLDKIIGALLKTRPSAWLKSPLARARAFGQPYDPDRLHLFHRLFRELQASEFPYPSDEDRTPASAAHFAFFESYFSNYIEGTRFAIREAREIIRLNKPLPARNEDSHDILGTYRIVADPLENARTPESAEELLDILRSRHAILLAARSDKAPGRFKDRNNFAGNTAFTDFTLVAGTLTAAFDAHQALTHPFAKAAYIHFVVSEVHPFLDGNGRIARILMNAELSRGGLPRIIIPTVFREDYMGALRRLTRKGEPDTYVRMLRKAHAFSAGLHHDTMDDMQAHLTACLAFSDDPDDILRFPSAGSAFEGIAGG